MARRSPRFNPTTTLIAVTATMVAGVLTGRPAAAQAPPRDSALAVEPNTGAREPVAPVEGVDLRVYTSDGGASSLAEVLASMDLADVVLVGEEHDDMVGHGFQLQLLRGAANRFDAATSGGGRPVVLSLEMFERDVQYVVDEYLDGLISEDHFLKSARPWDEYEARYRPLVELAKDRALPVVAANAPRRYVNRVSREGPESLVRLSEQARAYLPPLPYPGPSDAYREQWDAVMAEAMAQMSSDTAVDGVAAEDTPAKGAAAPNTEPAADAPRHTPSANAIYSQALWDAAMGHAVAAALEEIPSALVLHMAGSFHVARGTGVPERIRDYRPSTRVVTVVMLKVDDVNAWDAAEHEDQADFLVLTRKPAAPPAGSR